MSREIDSKTQSIPIKKLYLMFLKYKQTASVREKWVCDRLYPELVFSWNQASQM